ncbi:hypothetical protein EUX98_g6340 [Antrodiella citrinella]|uniref:Sulfite efflux pump SSU1 n=1 Tax=Antrodiella citrinella TaxID=2447956 RepID=A0A4S4MR40_9APHY|nr:hypothetical protein EUX98_g6340 [Antrodiella citrinella]
MGTGAISILFRNFPYGSDTLPMRVFSAIFFFLNLFLFILFNVLTLTRYIIFPDIWSIMIRHPVQSLYIGTYPMGAATLINVSVSLLYSNWHIGGKPFLYTLWAFWWVDSAISVLCAFPMVHIMMTKQDHALNRMTAIWILPVVASIVAASSGGVLAPELAKYSTNHALLTLTLSLIMVSIGEALAVMMLTVYFFRLIVHGIPQGGSVISTFIPLGPMSQGGYCVLLLGTGFRSILPLSYGKSEFLRASTTGEIINVGVYANLTIELYYTLDSPFFRIYGCILAGATLVLWCGVFVRTLMFVRNGAIFEAPCLEEIDMARSEKRKEDAGNGHAVGNVTSR